MEPHGQSPCLHAEVPAFTEMLHASTCFGTQAWYLHYLPSYAQGFGGLSASHSSTAIGRGLLRRRITNGSFHEGRIS